MAKVPANIHFTGTIGNISFYQVGGVTFARAKSSLTRKRVLKSKEFEKTRKYASDLGTASRIGSAIYKALPADVKGRWVFRAITGDAASMLYAGKSEATIKDLLWWKYVDSIYGKKEEKVNSSAAPVSTKQTNRQWRTIFQERWEKQGKPTQFFLRAWQQGKSFNPDTIPRRSEYFLGLKHAGEIVPLSVAFPTYK
ncbi:MAG: hypothetical protein ABI480_12945 [Chitinophagaceae bacterium]